MITNILNSSIEKLISVNDEKAISLKKEGILTIRDLVQANEITSLSEEQQNAIQTDLQVTYGLKLGMSQTDIEIYEQFPASIVNKKIEDVKELNKCLTPTKLSRLKFKGIITVRDLIQTSPSRIKKVQGLGAVTIRNIQEALGKHGLSLGMTPESIKEYCRIRKNTDETIAAIDEFIDKQLLAEKKENDPYAEVKKALKNIEFLNERIKEAEQQLNQSIAEAYSRASKEELPMVANTILKLIRDTHF